MGLSVDWKNDTVDEYGKLFCIRDIAQGAMHDDCFLVIKPPSNAVKIALLYSTLAMHEHYLGRQLDDNTIVEELVGKWQCGTILRMRSNTSRGCLNVTICPRSTGLLWRGQMQKLTFFAS